jgi:hypothetical protein
MAQREKSSKLYAEGSQGMAHGAERRNLKKTNFYRFLLKAFFGKKL